MDLKLVSNYAITDSGDEKISKYNQTIKSLGDEEYNQIKPIRDIIEEMEQKINDIKALYRKQYDLVTNELFNDLFSIGSIIKYNCKGSGYMGIYEGFNDKGKVILNICNKQGISKGKIIEISSKCYSEWVLIK